MAFFKESVIVAFIAAQAMALPAPQAATTSAYQCNPAHSYPNGQTCDATALTLVTAAPASTTSAYKCNPAHSYPNGQSCDGSALTLVYPSTTAPASSASASPYKCNPAHSYPNGQSCDGSALTLVYPSTTAPASSASASPYKCNPAHSYPNGQSCDGSALTLVYPSTTAPASTVTATAYQCNPAHSYPNGQSCDGSALTLVYPSTTAPASTAAATPAATAASKSGKCPLDLPAGTFEFPHLLEVNGVNGYFGHVGTSTNTSFTFDIPASDIGKNCNTYFALPAKGTMETSDYTLTTSDGVKIAVSDGQGKEVASFIPEENESWLIYSSKCPAGQQIKYEMSATGAMDLTWFQDYNPCALGMYVVVS